MLLASIRNLHSSLHIRGLVGRGDVFVTPKCVVVARFGFADATRVAP